MKLLWLYKYSRQYDFDNWLHLKYIQWMKANGFSVSAYGPRIHEEYPDIVDIKWDPHITWSDLLRLLKFDAVVLMTKSRMFEEYNPFHGVADGCILPKGFAESRAVPKIMIEEDFMYESDDGWYHEQGIDLLLQRHSSQALRTGVVPTAWFPFSVDTDVFTPLNTPRANKLCLCCSMSSLYRSRIEAKNILESRGLVDCVHHTGQLYVKCLNSYVSHVCGVVAGCGYPITPAKLFEIASSGSVLFTDRFPGIEKLFPDDAYVSFSTDPNDILEKANMILTNKDLRVNTVMRGIDTINKKHTHEIRTLQLFDLIQNEIWKRTLSWDCLV